MSVVALRKAFKYNIAKAGGPLGTHIEQKHNPQPWKAKYIVQCLQAVQKELSQPELVHAVSIFLLYFFNSFKLLSSIET